LALFALQVATTLAQNATCNPGPCVGPEVIALESSDCQDYHVFLARGSDSGYPGHLGPLTKLICDGLGDSCGYENIIYPAKSQYRGPGAWCESAHAGAENGQAQLASYAERCPDSKLILAGYSQGGSVSLDILGGGGGAGFGCDDQAYNAPLSGTEAPGSHSKSCRTQNLPSAYIVYSCCCHRLRRSRARGRPELHSRANRYSQRRESSRVQRNSDPERRLPRCYKAILQHPPRILQRRRSGLR
jgi:hypothetical protein